MGFLKDFYRCFMLGFTGEYKGYTLEEYHSLTNDHKAATKENKQENIKAMEIPYYIDLEIQAIREQLKVNDQIIQEYRWKEQLAMKESDKLLWKKKRIDMEYKQTQLDKKQYKLIEKYNINHF